MNDDPAPRPAVIPKAEAIEKLRGAGYRFEQGAGLRAELWMHKSGIPFLAAYVGRDDAWVSAESVQKAVDLVKDL